jgi:hypothetical protein
LWYSLETSATQRVPFMIFTPATKFYQVNHGNKLFGGEWGIQEKHMKSGGKTNLNVATWKPEIDVQL